MNNESHMAAVETTRRVIFPTEPGKAMTPGEVMRELGVSRSTFCKYQREGKLKRFLLPRAIGVRKYSRRLVAAYLDGSK